MRVNALINSGFHQDGSSPYAQNLKKRYLKIVAKSEQDEQGGENDSADLGAFEEQYFLKGGSNFA